MPPEYAGRVGEDDHPRLLSSGPTVPSRDWTPFAVRLRGRLAGDANIDHLTASAAFSAPIGLLQLHLGKLDGPFGAIWMAGEVKQWEQRSPTHQTVKAVANLHGDSDHLVIKCLFMAHCHR